MTSKKEDDYIIVTCPICLDYVQIYKKELNCKIFRHAVFKKNYMNIPPHSTKEVIDKMLKDGNVYGCGSPFQIKLKDGQYETISCGYI